MEKWFDEAKMSANPDAVLYLVCSHLLSPCLTSLFSQPSIQSDTLILTPCLVN